ncbi:MAG: hypothetical protein Q9165_006863 [Trypethelium subeluteriae]
MANLPITKTSGIVIAIVVYTFFPWHTWHSSNSVYHRHQPLEQWDYNFTRDGDDKTLTKEQCAIAFPNNTYEIQDAVSRLDGKKIPYDKLNIALERTCTRLIIYDGKLYVLEGATQENSYMGWLWEQRTIGTIMMIYDAIVGAKPGTIPNIEFPFCADDDAIRAHRGISWGYTRHNAFEDQRQVWVIPDFGYWEWYSSKIYSYADARRRIIQRANNLTWAERKPQMIWRGATKFNPMRGKLVDQASGKGWSDVQDCAGGSCYVELEDHCNYQFILYTEGATYSGRMKYLQQCKSAMIMHTIHWITHSSHLLHWDGPEQNIIKVEDDWTDLEEKVQYYLSHPQEAEAVAERGYKLFAERYQTQAAISCYFRSLFDAWGAHQGYVVNLWDENGHMRGAPFESYAVARTYLGNSPHVD